ncbi:MAG: PQQ-dependent sugar dehydrogenase [Candidatus Microthrix parvicella]|uniref:PQQ-dependent sugar dehydrogenase n=1 Tax=Candidatus Neomicrothrix sp. TaxID=2719034 RepID=UPI0025C35ED0|nr:PQQ-dependent sugar dehydrogenase [Candidatus Microthrix sp.]MBK7322935.1 PQQ-dependent sugar dehydrogenase [Candidatus Microthrix sp.]MBL0206129.1 PQQ-dependent sugar dehydrogenase [Candidatus Microthrix sp.]
MRDRARQRSPDIRRSVRRPGRWWLLGALLVVGGCASDSVKAGPANETTPEVVDAPVTEVARFSAPSATALAVRPDGTLLVGERLTGRIFSADPDSATTSNLATVKDLDTGMTQGGLLGLALTSEGGILVSYTSSDGHIVIDQTDASARNFTRRWDGPKTSERANGGRLAVLGGDTHDQNTLIIGIGDLLDPAKTPRPDTANGKLLRIDEEGGAGPWASGFNNPFALGSDETNTIWVADNSPGEQPERLLRVTAARAEVVASWVDTRVPSGLAVTDDGALAICYYQTGDLMLVDPDDPQGGTGPRVADDCRYGVVSLGDGRLAYSTEREVVVVDTDG